MTNDESMPDAECRHHCRQSFVSKGFIAIRQSIVVAAAVSAAESFLALPRVTAAATTGDKLQRDFIDSPRPRLRTTKGGTSEESEIGNRNS
jgi:hypothetical protein